MAIPGFSGEASLYEGRGNCRGATASFQIDAASISPAWGIDCYPMCVIFGEARCRRICPPHSIDCLPMCIFLTVDRCRRLCEGGLLSL
jgi:hypothetical protein